MPGKTSCDAFYVAHFALPGLFRHAIFPSRIRPKDTMEVEAFAKKSDAKRRFM